LPVLESALERAGCDGLQEIVLTHGHPDHNGGVESVLDRFGPLEVKKFPWPAFDDRHDFVVTPLSDGSVVKTEGATLRALHTPGHAPDHLCFMLEEDDALISGDNVLGVGTTVIPSESGDLADYMNSLELALEQRPGRIYPAHGPMIDDGVGKLEEYIAHRNARETQILAALEAGPATAAEIVEIVYAEYPKLLHAAARQSVTSHLLKLAREQRVDPDGASLAPSTRWSVRTPR
jgi:ribonuclease/clavin/mitogillin